MRTTLTLDEDVAEFLKARSRLQDKPFKQVVNEVLPRGMAPGPQQPELPIFRVVPNRSGLVPGADPLRLTSSTINSKWRTSPGRAAGDCAGHEPVGLCLQRGRVVRNFKRFTDLYPDVLFVSSEGAAMQRSSGGESRAVLGRDGAGNSWSGVGCLSRACGVPGFGVGQSWRSLRHRQVAAPGRQRFGRLKGGSVRAASPRIQSGERALGDDLSQPRSIPAPARPAAGRARDRPPRRAGAPAAPPAWPGGSGRGATGAGWRRPRCRRRRRGRRAAGAPRRRTAARSPGRRETGLQRVSTAPRIASYWPSNYSR